MILERIATFGRSCFEVLACLHHTTNVSILTVACIVIYLRLVFSSYWYLALVYLGWYFYDRETPFRDGRNFAFFRNFFLWKYFASYFPATLHKTADLDPSKNYLFAFHPHGIFVYGGVVNFATNATGFDRFFPGLTMHFTVLNGYFKYFPFYRDYAIAAGFTAADARSIEYKLTKMGPGHSVLVAIGGAAEMELAASSETYTLKLKYRKGFVRSVLKTGALLVPVFSFNETRVYDTEMPAKGSTMYYLQKLFKFVTGMTVPAAYGPGYWHWFLPKRVPINTVVGAPIDFTEFRSKLQPGQVPPGEMVNECHKIYLDALTKLYDENKARFGDENTPLIFV